MFSKIIVVVMSVLGAYIAVPMFWPFLKNVAFHLNQVGLQSTFPVTYSLLFAAMVFVLGAGLSAKG